MTMQKAYNPMPARAGYDPGGPVLVEKQGYRSTLQIVNEMIAAGKQLKAYRELCDQPDGKLTDIQPDPTRSGNFDLADATAISRRINTEYMRKKRIFAERKAKKEADAASQKESENKTSTKVE
jgi:flagellar basal body rod protein FlgC